MQHRKTPKTEVRQIVGLQGGTKVNASSCSANDPKEVSTKRMSRQEGNAEGIENGKVYLIEWSDVEH